MCQRIDRLGSTMLHAFCHKQNLNVLIKQLLQIDCDERVRSLAIDYIRAFESDNRGTLQGELLSGIDETSSETAWMRAQAGEHEFLEPNTAQLVRRWFARNDPQSHKCSAINPYVIPKDKVCDRGIVYKPVHVSKGDSGIVFTLEGEQIWRAGHITKIFLYYKHIRDGTPPITQTFYLVQAFERLTTEHARRDPYRKFCVAGGRLFYAAFEPITYLLTKNDITCHFASIPRRLPGDSVQCVHVLPLDKVSHHHTQYNSVSNTVIQW